MCRHIDDVNWLQKQPSRGVLGERCSENILCNLIEIVLRHGCFPVKLLHTFRTLFLENTSRGLLLWLVKEQHLYNPYHATSLFLFSLKTSENIIWKNFLIFSGGIEKDHWNKINWYTEPGIANSKYIVNFEIMHTKHYIL